MSRSRRSLLFMPGDDRHKIEKGIAAEPDSIIMDLEDGVAPNRRAVARDTIRQALGELDFGRCERLVRVNPVTTLDFDADFGAVAPGRPDGLVIPKVDDAAHLRIVHERLTALEDEEGWPRGGIRLIAIIETARAVVNLREIAAFGGRLAALCFGAEDLAGDTGAIRQPDLSESAYARGAVVVHAKAYRLQAIDTPYVALTDLDGLAAEARTALTLGYTGKLAVHPRQIAPLQRVFTPNEAEIAAARALIAGYRAHQADGTGAYQTDGRMVDVPMIRAAEAMLERARLAGTMDAGGASSPDS